jgi:hypothetical protein
MGGLSVRKPQEVASEDPLAAALAQSIAQGEVRFRASERVVLHVHAGQEAKRDPLEELHPHAEPIAARHPVEEGV